MSAVRCARAAMRSAPGSHGGVKTSTSNEFDQHLRLLPAFLSAPADASNTIPPAPVTQAAWPPPSEPGVGLCPAIAVAALAARVAPSEHSSQVDVGVGTSALSPGNSSPHRWQTFTVAVGSVAEDFWAEPAGNGRGRQDQTQGEELPFQHGVPAGVSACRRSGTR